MADAAVFFNRGMTVFPSQLLFDILMAFKAELPLFFGSNQQLFIFRGMGPVASYTVATCNRAMLMFFGEYFFFMALKTEATDLFPLSPELKPFG